MSQVCTYCKELREDKLSCCDENHWEEEEGQVYDPPMTQTEEYLLLKQCLQDFNDYWHQLD